MDLQAIDQRFRDCKPVKWRGKRWYILSMNMMLKTVSLVNQPIGYVGSETERDVPMEEIGVTSKRGDIHGHEG